MLVHLAARIKMGAGDVPAPAAYRSPGQAEHQKERAIQSFASVRIERSYNSPNPIAAKRIQLIGHDLRADKQAVLCGWFNDGAQPIGRIDVGRHRADN